MEHEEKGYIVYWGRRNYSLGTKATSSGTRSAQSVGYLGEWYAYGAQPELAGGQDRMVVPLEGVELGNILSMAG